VFNKAQERNGIRVQRHQGETECNRWYRSKLLGLVGKASKAFGGKQMLLNQMASNESIPSTMDVVESKTKKKYKTKKENEKKVAIQELIALKKTTVGKEMREEMIQSFKEMVEEATKLPPCKSKKKIQK
jgi:hypothetical protein